MESTTPHLQNKPKGTRLVLFAKSQPPFAPLPAEVTPPVLDGGGRPVGHFVGAWNGTTAAKHSWWVGLDRGALVIAIQTELPRMVLSKVGHSLRSENRPTCDAWMDARRRQVDPPGYAQSVRAENVRAFLPVDDDIVEDEETA